MMAFLSPIIERLHYRNLVYGLSNLPYLIRSRPPSFRLDVLQNARLAGNVISEWKRNLGLSPNQIIDVGANHSQVSRWFIKQWPQAELHSFEPNPNAKPLGTVHRVACGSKPGNGYLTPAGHNGEQGFILSHAGSIPVQIVRLDKYPIKFKPPVLLKIDAEHHTFDALNGCNGKLKHVSMVVIEVWNAPINEQTPYVDNQVHIWNSLLARGFNRVSIVDATYSEHGWTSTDVAFMKVKK